MEALRAPPPRFSGLRLQVDATQVPLLRIAMGWNCGGLPTACTARNWGAGRSPLLSNAMWPVIPSAMETEWMAGLRLFASVLPPLLFKAWASAIIPSYSYDE